MLTLLFVIVSFFLGIFVRARFAPNFIFEDKKLKLQYKDSTGTLVSKTIF